MRASQWLLGGATAAAIVAAIASGCGGSTNSSSPQDSGTDVTNDVVAEAAPKEAAAETSTQDSPAACVPDADITHLTIPDASIGDSGASTDGCYACIQTTCSTQLSACNADCTCNTAVRGFLTCVAAGGSTLSCGTSLATGGGSAGLPLGLCVAGSAVPGGSGAGCLHACGVSLPEGGIPTGDGGGDAASDTGASDATGQ
jgi:hypothetical protein